MTQSPRILAFAGSTREASLNKKLMRIGPPRRRPWAVTSRWSICATFPCRSYDETSRRRKGLPPAARKLKDLFLSHQGILISSPEYNSSISGVLKNAIDWLSRPVPGERPLGCFENKVAGLLSASPGQLGGLRGLVHLRAILGNIKVLVLPDQVSIPRRTRPSTRPAPSRSPSSTRPSRRLPAGSSRC